MRIKFWGVRGSIAVPGPDTLAVGGNTACVEVRCDDILIVLDGGTGIRLLGQALLGEMPVEAYIFFSHVHWDHIQGFPFFTPAFVKGNRFHLYGGNNVTHTLEETLAGQMDYPSFPVHLTDMGAKMTFRDLQEGEMVTISGKTSEVRVTTAPGFHPNGVYAYRIDYQGKSVVYCTDTEHRCDDVVDDKLAALASDADVLIYDTMYLPEEYRGELGAPKVGWGHSTHEHGIRLARHAGVRQFVLFHHDPSHNDAAVDAKEARARALFPNSIAAREGLVIEL